MNLLDATKDPDLFARWFKVRETWEAWFAFIAALFALPMTAEQLELYRRHTGRTEAPTAPSDEAWLVIGRRGGKSFVMALIAVFLACFRSYEAFLQPGERGTIMVLAADRRQARVIMRYVRGLLENIPLLEVMIDGDFRADGVDLSNLVTIEVGTASFRTSRGYTLIAAICDEIAFWRGDDSAEPDYEILDAIRPGLATIPGAMLLCASSPYARRGALWDAYRKFFGKADMPLVWKAGTRDMNPTVRQLVIERALERDEASAKAEFMAEFRSDLEALLTREAIAAVVDRGVLERSRITGAIYRGFVDPSGGSSDAMTLAIGHLEDGIAVLDAVREKKPPFSPEAVVEEFAAVLKSYGLSDVVGDRYGGEWPREAFRRHGIEYGVAEQTRSEIYLATVPVINSRRCRLLDLPHLENQLIALERRTSRTGRDIVDHPIGGHDDVANSAAGVVALVIGEQPAFQWFVNGTVIDGNGHLVRERDRAGEVVETAIDPEPATYARLRGF